jgi:hypothetical protein
MTRIVPFKPWHLSLVDPQPEQALLVAGHLNDEYGEAFLAAGPAWSCVDLFRVYGCAGFVVEKSQATAWAILGRDIGPHFTLVHRQVARTLANSNFPLVVTAVRHGFDAGERWAAMLGFEREKIAWAAGPDGQDYDLWSIDRSVH